MTDIIAEENLAVFTFCERHVHTLFALDDAGIRRDDPAKIRKFLPEAMGLTWAERELFVRLLTCNDFLDDAQLAKAGLAIVGFGLGYKMDHFVDYADAKECAAQEVKTYNGAETATT